MKKKHILLAVAAVAVFAAALVIGLILGRPEPEPEPEPDTPPIVISTDDHKEAQKSEAQNEFPKTMYVSTEDGLMLRKGPGTDNDIIQLMQYGQEISVEKVENGWAYTSVGGKAGWCSAEYLTEDKGEIKAKPKQESSSGGSNELVEPENRATEGYHGHVDEPDGLNMRYGPGTDYGIIMAIPDKAEVIEYGWENGWIFVEYKGKYGWINGQYLLFEGGREKPVIYLYPTHTTDVDVKITLKNGVLTETIPASSDGSWSVTAEPDGTLTDKATGLKYDYIFWESSDDTEYDWSHGFVVAGYETEDFLNLILPKMGLNAKETAEFIEYWLPRMEKNKFNQVSFQTDRYTDNVGLDVSPEPDSVLRVFMTFREMDEPHYVPAQKIVPFERKGFTVVEWGGAEVK